VNQPVLPLHECAAESVADLATVESTVEPLYSLADPAATSRDRTTSQMRGLSPKIISGDSQQSENAQTHTYKHTIPYMKFKLKLLHIKCHVLEFTKDASKIIRVFAEVFISHDRHTLFALEESGPPQMTYTCESQ
jgi:hypothetical protein